MKLLVVNKLYHPWVGGVESIVRECAEYFFRRGACVTALVCQVQGFRSDEIIHGVRVLRAASFGMLWGMPLSLDFFQCFFRESKRADIIAIHHPFPLADLAIFFMRPKAHIIVHYHSDIVRQGIVAYFLAPLFRFTLSRAKKIVVSSNNLLVNSPLLTRYQDKCQIIPFPINLIEIDAALSLEIQNTIKKKYGDYIIFVGRFSYYKGLEYLIKALSASSIQLICIGDGPLKKRMRVLVKKMGFENRVVFLTTQPRDQLLNFMAAARMCILPSTHKSEAFGIVLAEALACGTPVVSTELGTGTSFVNQNGKTGIVVPPRDSAKLAEAIALLLEGDELRLLYGTQGREWIEQICSYDRNMVGLKSIYKECD